MTSNHSARHVCSLPPGPRLPRVAQAALRLWSYSDLSDRGHQRYGDTFTVRFGTLPTAVLTRDRDAIRRLYTGDPLTKRHGNDLLRSLMGERSVLMLEPTEHLTRRRMLLPSFHAERIQSYASLIENLTRSELERWEPGAVLHVQPVARTLTLNVILQAVLGISDVAVRRRLHRIFDALNTPLNAFAWLVPQVTHRSRWNVLSRRPWHLKDELDALLLERIAATRADALLPQRGDILAIMVRSRDENGVGLTDEELRDELLTLIMAGHETTANAIAWGVELLVHNPAVMVEVRDRERDDIYLEALAKEILRIRSPFPVTSARHILEPFAIGEWTIHPDVMILVDAYGVHHDPRIYDEPHVFHPERFLTESPDAYSFLPFGGGAHRCLGASLALLELKTVLGALLAHVELAPTSTKPARSVPCGPTVAPRAGARVRVLSKLK